MEENKVYHGDWMDNNLPDKSVQLIIADPPYFQVKGEFDFIWNSFEDYLKDVEKWAIECKRILADNGTILWYGDAKNIAYSQIIFDKHFNLINNLVWNKGSFMGLEESECLRSFAPCTERILMYGSKNQDLTGLNEIYSNDNCFSSLKAYIKDQAKKAFNPIKKINIFLGFCENGGMATRKYIGNTQWQLPTKEHYLKLQTTGYFQKPYEELRKEYEELRKEYEELRKEYEELRRPFNNRFNLQEVLNFSNEQAKTGAKYDHDTVKPETLTRALILTCSRPNDLVVVPFAGSGTECAMSVKEGRRFIGFDVNKKYVDMANERCSKIISSPELF